ncbi:MAG: peptidylprolyl isomerase [Bacillota bacterium]
MNQTPAGRAAACSAFLLVSTLAGCSGAPPQPTDLAPALAPAAVTHTSVPVSATNVAPAPGVLLDRVAAVVNEDVILKSELDKRVEETSRQIAMQNAGATLPDPAVLRKQVLDQMVTVRLELEQADNRGISVSDDAVNQAMTRIAARGHVTLEQLPDTLKQQGIDYGTFRQDIRNQIVIQNLQQQVLSDQLRITQQEIDDQIRTDQSSGDADTQYKLSQILVATPLNPTPDDIAKARKRADDIYQKLKGGADFASTAIASSDDQQALNGGLIGWRKGAELPSIFSNVVPQMKPGDFSEPIQSVSGFHIVKVDDVKRSDAKVMVTQTHARHILIHVTAIVSSEQAKAKIDGIYQQLKAGSDFDALARQYSDDPGSAKQGGDLGWLDPGATVQEFQDAMDKLKPGEMSEPFQTQFGWHIVQVLGRRDVDQTQENQKQKAYEAIFARKSEEVIQHWLSELKDSAFIEYHLDD